MFSELLRDRDLYDLALLEPAIQGADELEILSGYASPAMVSRVLSDVKEATRRGLRLTVVVGMVGREGVWVRDHDGYVALMDGPAEACASVLYTVGKRSVHSKIYVWSRAGEPFRAFVGSSNFTQNGFLVNSRRGLHSEVLVEVDAHAAKREFDRVESEAIFANHPDVDSEVMVLSKRPNRAGSIAVADESTGEVGLSGAEAVVLPLVALGGSALGTVAGAPHKQWGLNWGQRGSRDHNQAVIPIPKRVWDAHPDFFPRGVAGDRPQFQVTTFDNKSLFFVVAEAGDKALHSVPSNALVGEYFRGLLGVGAGAPVTRASLEAAGSRFVKIYRLEDDSYFLDYSPEIEEEGVALYGV